MTLLEELTAPDHVKLVFLTHAPYRRLIYERHGPRLRKMFDRLEFHELKQPIREAIKQASLWLQYTADDSYQKIAICL